MTTPAPPPLSPAERHEVDSIVARAARLSIEARRRLWRLFAEQERAYARAAVTRERRRQRNRWASPPESSSSDRA